MNVSLELRILSATVCADFGITQGELEAALMHLENGAQLSDYEKFLRRNAPDLFYTEKSLRGAAYVWVEILAPTIGKAA